MVEIIKALAWPVGIIVILCVAPFSIRAIIRALKEANLHLKAPGGFEARIERSGAIDSVSLDSPSPATRLADDSKSAALTLVESGDDALPKPSVADDHFYFVQDPAILAARFAAFRASDDAYDADPDFWEAIYVERRRDLGVGGADQELQALGDQHPDWIWPRIFLLRRAAALGGYEEAEALVVELIDKHGFAKDGQAYIEAARFYFSWRGIGRALDFVRSAISDGADADLAAKLLLEVASLNEDKQNPFTHVLLREVAIRYAPGDRNRRFDIAYTYGDHPAFSALSCQHYHQIIDSDPSHAHSKNNLGILYHSFGKVAVHHDYMDQAAAQGELLATANLARSLASEGFVGRAEKLIEDTDWSEDEEQHARASAAVIEQRKLIPEAIAKVRKESEKDFVEFQRIVGISSRYWIESGSDWVLGKYESVVGQGVISVDVGARIEITINGKVYTGTLQRQPLCAGGWISEAGASLLGADRRQAALFFRSATEASLLIWPSNAQPSGLINIDVRKLPD
ncbi:hypothetical protein [Brevundimonas sp.]|uniref:tetratricopeptide repeat protein n=1 Tax=Brevundimonas sp. TaxID=1871086 RepID=UPI002D75CCA5|nr:hypothetical protein [Brevundimonas sp.]HYD27894.1 hypothetical protein [Brevundimonas sp.]